MSTYIYVVLTPGEEGDEDEVKLLGTHVTYEAACENILNNIKEYRLAFLKECHHEEFCDQEASCSCDNVRIELVKYSDENIRKAIEKGRKGKNIFTFGRSFQIRAIEIDLTWGFYSL